MQHVLERGDGETARLLVERLMADVVDLSLHSIGSYVVEACYQRAELLPCVLAAILRLDDACLVQLVQGPHSNYVVHKLLDTAWAPWWQESVVGVVTLLPPATAALPWTLSDRLRESLSGASQVHRMATLPPHPP
jgi:hypothetical protein